MDKKQAYYTPKKVCDQINKKAIEKRDSIAGKQKFDSTKVAFYRNIGIFAVALFEVMPRTIIANVNYSNYYVESHQEKKQRSFFFCALFYALKGVSEK